MITTNYNFIVDMIKINWYQLQIMSLNEILTGCIFSRQTVWPGLVKLEYCPPEKIQEVSEIPGYIVIRNSKSGGVYIPLNLVDMGKAPGGLDGYEPDPYPCTPSGMPLRRHQLKSVTFLRQITAERQGGMLCADPGLGKCIMSLQSLWLDGFLHKKGLIIAPLGARSAWCSDTSDAFKHYSLKVIALEGTTPDPEVLQNGNWFFIHYEILPEWSNWLFSTLRPESLIVDEAHMCMNAGATRTSAVLGLSKLKVIQRRILLTGTPIPKTRMDLWPQLAIAQPNQWGDNKYHYGMKYCAGRRESYDDGRGHFVYDGQSNTEELRARLCGVYLRYTKNDVEGVLPELTRETLKIDLFKRGQLDKYWSAQSNFGAYLRKKMAEEGVAPTESASSEGISLGFAADVESPVEEKKQNAAQLVSITTLISLLEQAKLLDSTNCISELMQKHQKMVVFAWRRESAKWLSDWFNNVSQINGATSNGIRIFGPIDGSMNQVDREAAGKEFSAHDGRALFICTRGAMGTALNELSCAEACLQISPAWNPSDNLQAESRVHRDGNKHAHVYSYYLIVSGTIDDLFITKLEKKAAEAKSISGNDVDGLHLVGDISPQFSGGHSPEDLDEICKILSELEED